MGKDTRNAAKTERAWLCREAERRARKAKDEASHDRPAAGGSGLEKSSQQAAKAG